MKFITLFLTVLSVSSPVYAGTADIEVMVEIVNSDGVGEGDYTFDYNVWKLQCCKQVTRGVTTQLHYNCQTLIEDDRLDNCPEWVDVTEYGQ